VTDYSIKLCREVSGHFGEEIAGDCLLLVNHLSKDSRKNQVQHYARYFRREFRYDFVQFDGPRENDDSFEAWLFFPSGMYSHMITNIPVGACCFRKRKYENTDEYWALQWVWIHPYERGKGIYKKAFETFKERYGEFKPEYPLSKTMQNFVDKYYDGFPKKSEFEKEEDYHNAVGKYWGKKIGLKFEVSQ
jgi:hypothetical protein